VCCSCCSVLQCVVVCCSVLHTNKVDNLLLHFATVTRRCVAVCCRNVAVYCGVVQCGAVSCSMLQYVAVCCSVLQYIVAVCCSVL